MIDSDRKDFFALAGPSALSKEKELNLADVRWLKEIRNESVVV